MSIDNTQVEQTKEEALDQYLTDVYLSMRRRVELHYKYERLVAQFYEMKQNLKSTHLDNLIKRYEFRESVAARRKDAAIAVYQMAIANNYS